jgi:hypothetical protein
MWVDASAMAVSWRTKSRCATRRGLRPELAPADDPRSGARSPRVAEGATVSIGHPHAGFHVSEIPGGLVVDLSSPRRWLTATLVGAWLAGWVVGLAFIVQQFRGGESVGPDRVFLLAWAVMWLVAGGWAFAYLAWLLAGHERVTLEGGRLRIWRGVWRFGIARDYDIAGIGELRTFGRDVVPLLAIGLDFAGQGASGVRFRYAGRVVRFARALDEPSAHALVDRLRAGAACAGAGRQDAVKPTSATIG